jgi:hypothetical protein
MTSGNLIFGLEFKQLIVATELGDSGPFADVEEG